MGQRFRLKANYDISGFAPEVQVILRAMKKYGIILADNGSAWFISGVPDERWNNDNLRQLHSVYGSAFEAVDSSALMIDPNSGQVNQGATPTPTQPGPSATPPPTATFTLLPTPTFTATPPPSGDDRLYLSSTTNGTAGGVSFADEDLLHYQAGSWSLYFDGSDVGLSNQDIDAFSIQANGSLLLSFDGDFTLSGFGAVDDSDILAFSATSLGGSTAGTFSWYFDGSDVGLTTKDEDVDAFAFAADGRLLISTLGTASVTGASAADEDLLAFAASQLGATTSGSWSLYFDGSDVGLGELSTEDVNGAWINPSTGAILLTTTGSYAVPGLSGDGADLIACTPLGLGANTACTWTLYWDGSASGFAGEVIDALDVVP
jgi:hypothetical protein